MVNDLMADGTTLVTHFTAMDRTVLVLKKTHLQAHLKFDSKHLMIQGRR